MRTLVTAALVSFAMTLASVDPSRAAVTDNLQAYWPLDGNGNDQIGSVNLTPMVNAGYVGTGVVAQAGTSGPEVSGQNSAFHSASPVGSTFGITDAFTIAGWYRIDTLGSSGEKSSFRQFNGVFGYYNPDNTSTYFYQARWSDGGPQSTAANVNLPTNTGEWYHVVQRVTSSGEMSFWHSNIAAASHGAADSATNLSGYVGMDTSLLTAGGVSLVTAYYEGKSNAGGTVSSDEVAIWNRALSDSEIEELFALGKAGIPVPEPHTIVLTIIGASTLLALYRRRAIEGSRT